MLGICFAHISFLFYWGGGSGFVILLTSLCFYCQYIVGCPVPNLQLSPFIETEFILVSTMWSSHFFCIESVCSVILYFLWCIGGACYETFMYAAVEYIIFYFVFILHIKGTLTRTLYFFCYNSRIYLNACVSSQHIVFILLIHPLWKLHFKGKIIKQ